MEIIENSVNNVKSLELLTQNDNGSFIFLLEIVDKKKYIMKIYTDCIETSLQEFFMQRELPFAFESYQFLGTIILKKLMKKFDYEIETEYIYGFVMELFTHTLSSLPREVLVGNFEIIVEKLIDNLCTLHDLGISYCNFNPDSIYIHYNKKSRVLGKVALSDFSFATKNKRVSDAREFPLISPESIYDDWYDPKKEDCYMLALMLWGVMVGYNLLDNATEKDISQYLYSEDDISSIKEFYNSDLDPTKYIEDELELSPLENNNKEVNSPIMLSEEFDILVKLKMMKLCYDSLRLDPEDRKKVTDLYTSWKLSYYYKNYQIEDRHIKPNILENRDYEDIIIKLYNSIDKENAIFIVYAIDLIVNNKVRSSKFTDEQYLIFFYCLFTLIQNGKDIEFCNETIKDNLINDKYLTLVMKKLTKENIPMYFVSYPGFDIDRASELYYFLRSIYKNPSIDEPKRKETPYPQNIQFNANSPNKNYNEYNEYKRESPIKEYKQESPIKEYKRESPIKQYKQESPIKQYKQESPIKEYKQESPIKEYNEYKRESLSPRENITESTLDDSSTSSSDVEVYVPVNFLKKLDMESYYFYKDLSDPDKVRFSDIYGNLVNDMKDQYYETINYMSGKLIEAKNKKYSDKPKDVADLMIINDKLKSSNKILDVKNRELQYRNDQVEKLLEEFNEIKNDNDNMKNTINVLNKKIENAPRLSSSNDLDLCQRELVAIRGELDTIRNEYENYKYNVSQESIISEKYQKQLEEKNEKLMTENKGINQKRITELEQKNQALTYTINDLRKKHQSNENVDLQNELNSYKSQLDSCKSELDYCKSKLNAYENDLNIYSEAISKNMIYIDGLKNELEASKQNVENLQKELQNNNNNTDLMQENNVLREEKDKLNRINETILVKLDNLKATRYNTNMELSNKITLCNEELTKYKKYYEQLKLQKDNDNQELISKNNELTERISKLVSDYNEMEDELEKYKSSSKKGLKKQSISAIEELVDEKNDLIENMNLMVEKYNEMEKEVEKYKKYAEELSSKSKNSNVDNSKYVEVLQKNSTILEENSKLIQKNKKLALKVSEIKDVYETALSKHKDLNNQIELLNDQKQKLSDKLKNQKLLENEINFIKDEKTAIKDELKNLLNQKTQQIELLKNEQNKCKNEINQLKTELSESIKLMNHYKKQFEYKQIEVNKFVKLLDQAKKNQIDEKYSSDDEFKISRVVKSEFYPENILSSKKESYEHLSDTINEPRLKDDDTEYAEDESENLEDLTFKSKSFNIEQNDNVSDDDDTKELESLIFKTKSDDIQLEEQVYDSIELFDDEDELNKQQDIYRNNMLEYIDLLDRSRQNINIMKNILVESLSVIDNKYNYFEEISSLKNSISSYESFYEILKDSKIYDVSNYNILLALNENLKENKDKLKNKIVDDVNTMKLNIINTFKNVTKDFDDLVYFKDISMLDPYFENKENKDVDYIDQDRYTNNISLHLILIDIEEKLRNDMEENKKIVLRDDKIKTSYLKERVDEILNDIHYGKSLTDVKEDYIILKHEYRKFLIRAKRNKKFSRIVLLNSLKQFVSPKNDYLNELNFLDDSVESYKEFYYILKLEETDENIRNLLKNLVDKRKELVEKIKNDTSIMLNVIIDTLKKKFTFDIEYFIIHFEGNSNIITKIYPKYHAVSKPSNMNDIDKKLLEIMKNAVYSTKNIYLINTYKKTFNFKKMFGFKIKDDELSEISDLTPEIDINKRIYKEELKSYVFLINKAKENVKYMKRMITDTFDDDLNIFDPLNTSPRLDPTSDFLIPLKKAIKSYKPFYYIIEYDYDDMDNEDILELTVELKGLKERLINKINTDLDKMKEVLVNNLKIYSQFSEEKYIENLNVLDSYLKVGGSEHPYKNNTFDSDIVNKSLKVLSRLIDELETKYNITKTDAVKKSSVYKYDDPDILTKDIKELIESNKTDPESTDELEVSRNIYRDEIQSFKKLLIKFSENKKVLNEVMVKTLKKLVNDASYDKETKFLRSSVKNYKPYYELYYKNDYKRLDNDKLQRLISLIVELKEKLSTKIDKDLVKMSLTMTNILAKNIRFDKDEYYNNLNVLLNILRIVPEVIKNVDIDLNTKNANNKIMYQILNEIKLDLINKKKAEEFKRRRLNNELGFIERLADLRKSFIYGDDISQNIDTEDYYDMEDQTIYEDDVLSINKMFEDNDLDDLRLSYYDEMTDYDEMNDYSIIDNYYGTLNLLE